MCGIGGVLMKHGCADPRLLERMAATLAHRGPDDLGMHVAGPLGMVQTRLSIIDLEHGHQPLVDGALFLKRWGERRLPPRPPLATEARLLRADASGTTVSIRRSRFRKISSMTGFTSQAISPPAAPTPQARSAPMATAIQCGFRYVSRRRSAR